MASGGLGAEGTSGSSEPLQFEFLQCFGERTPGEDIQEGATTWTRV